MITYFAALAIAAACLLVLWFAPSELAKQDPGTVRAVWYFFSLATVATVILAMWARSTGVVDEAGSFHGRFGELLRFLLHASFSINESIVIGIAGASIAVMPQIMSYVLSGIAGCASAPLFVGIAANFAAFMAIKSLAVAAGVLLPYSILGYFYNWQGFSLDVAFGSFLLSLIMAAEAFGLLYLYRGAPALSEFLKSHCPSHLGSVLAKTNRWMKRHI